MNWDVSSNPQTNIFKWINWKVYGEYVFITQDTKKYNNQTARRISLFSVVTNIDSITCEAAMCLLYQLCIVKDYFLKVI